MDATKTYHHGDLRAALIAAARSKLETDGYESLSLRALARDLGVASSAPYAHFSSRQSLLWALVDDGSEKLRIAFLAIASRDIAPDAKLELAGRAYLDFARHEPELTRLIYASPISNERISPADAARALEIFEAIVADVMKTEDAVRVRNTAIGCWSALHGFAMLRLHNRLAPDLDVEATADVVIQAAVRLARGS